MARLLVLWLLSERSSYGYEIKKALGDEASSFWFPLEDASIYSALRTMTKHGHVREVGTEQDGRRPPRTRYAITAQGRRHYRQLLIDALATPILPVSAVDIALAARGDLPPTDVGEALARRAKSLDEIAARIDSLRSATPSPEIANRNLALVEAERAWLTALDQSTIT